MEVDTIDMLIGNLSKYSDNIVNKLGQNPSVAIPCRKTKGGKPSFVILSTTFYQTLVDDHTKYEKLIQSDDFAELRNTNTRLRGLTRALLTQLKTRMEPNEEIDESCWAMLVDTLGTSGMKKGEVDDWQGVEE